MMEDERIQHGTDCWSENYSKAKKDQDFLSDDAGSQWDEKDYNKRRTDGRPALEMDQLEQYVNRVTNDMRASTPSITVSPKDEAANEETAQVYQGLIRGIEIDSIADDAYDTASDLQVSSGIGYVKIATEYASNTGFDQVLRIKKVVNPLSVFLDPDSVMVDGSDAKWGFEIECISEAAHEATYKGKRVENFKLENWGIPAPKEGYVNIVTMYEIEETPRTIVMTKNGEIRELGEGEKPDPTTTERSRVITTRRVKWTTRNGAGVLDSDYFPGKFVPFIPFYGKETWVEGKRKLRSLIRKAKDAQRMYNYWASTEMELLQKAPKAQVIAPRGTIEAYAELWRNPDGTSILPYEAYDDQDRQLPPPTIGNPIQIQEGIVNARNEAKQDVKDSLGLHDAYTGQKSNEVSGRALSKRNKESDNAIYHFTDNRTKSIRHVGVVLAHAIPEVYDAPRTVGIIGKDGKTTVIGVNGALVQGQQKTISLTKGQYSINVATGGSFSSQREAAAEFFEQLITTNPEMFNLIGDILCENLDFPGAQAVAKRMRVLLPELVQLAESGQDPVVLKAQQMIQKLTQALQQMKAENDQMKQQLQSRLQEAQIRATTELAKNETEKLKQQVAVRDLAAEERKTALAHEIDLAEIELEEQKLALKRLEIVRSANAVQTSTESESHELGENENE